MSTLFRNIHPTIRIAILQNPMASSRSFEVRDQAIEPVPTRYVLSGGRGGGRHIWSRKDMNEGFLIVCAIWSWQEGGRGKQYYEPENDVSYRICSITIARALSAVSS